MVKYSLKCIFFLLIQKYFFCFKWISKEIHIGFWPNGQFSLQKNVGWAILANFMGNYMQKKTVI